VLGFKRAGAIATTVAATAGALLIASSGQDHASASTIPLGQLQLCAQGDYPVYLVQRSVPIPGTNMTTTSVGSVGIGPGQPVSSGQQPGCWQEQVNTHGQWAPVEVYGTRPDGSAFSLGTQWYNSSVSGLGIGAEGKLSTGPYVWTW
jgi:hypothetical protein